EFLQGGYRWHEEVPAAGRSDEVYRHLGGGTAISGRITHRQTRNRSRVMVRFLAENRVETGLVTFGGEVGIVDPVSRDEFELIGYRGLITNEHQAALDRGLFVLVFVIGHVEPERDSSAHDAMGFGIGLRFLASFEFRRCLGGRGNVV